MYSRKQIVLHLLVVIGVVVAILGVLPASSGQNQASLPDGNAGIARVNQGSPSTSAGNPPVSEVNRPIKPSSIAANKNVGKPASKPIDQPNPLDYQRVMERQRLLESGQTAQAAALAQTGSDRVLVILVEYGGPDVFTWTAPITPTNPKTGSQWDPTGVIDPNKAVTDVDGNVVLGDCSNIITQTKTFTYTGPLHNTIERPRSAADASGTTIWTPDSNKQWFTDFMFGNGVVISYTRQDGSSVNVDFTGKSVRDYYHDLSSGTYTITGDVIGWLKLPHSTWYYGADTCPGAQSAGTSSAADTGGFAGMGDSSDLVRDALAQVNAISNTIPGFNWANYDLNGDGLIDRLWIVHAGYGEEDDATLLNRMPVSGTTPLTNTFYGEAAIWSHSASVTPVYSVTQNIAAGPYIVMPENGGMGVFAHEYAHNLGAIDLYSYSGGETSTGFWALQSDDWTGYPIGFEPPAPDPWHLDGWGWLNPLVVTDTSQVYTVTVGQASYFSTNTYTGTDQVYRGVKIPLDTGIAPLPVQPIGSYNWWGGKVNQSNGMMTSTIPITIPTGTTTPTLSFDMAYGAETQWDFVWIQASKDGGTTWDTLTNADTTCTHDSQWIGAQYGMNGKCGFTGYNPSFPDYDTETFDLSAYAGQSILLRFWYMTDWGNTYEGPFVDNVKVMAGATTVFSDDAESGDANWTYAAPWVRTNGTKAFTHNYYLQWRNTNTNGGYDSSLGDLRWRYGPANTGLLVWYNNNAYTDNEIPGYLQDFPSFGPKGIMLVVDSHPDPYRDPNNPYPNSIANVPSRSQMRDAPFTLQPTVGFTFAAANGIVTDTYFAGRPAVSAFNDALGYYPGIEYTLRGPSPCTTYQWYDKMWDASAVVPARDFYSTKATGASYTGQGIRMLGYVSGSTCGSSWYGFWYPPFVDATNSGNPGDVNGQYGWHVQVIQEAADHTWATVRIYNAPAYRATVAPTKLYQPGEQFVNYTVEMRNEGTVAQTRQVTVTLDPNLTFVSYSLVGGTVTAPSRPEVANPPHIWQVSLNAGEMATLIVTAKVTVSPNQSATLNTTVEQNDFINTVVSDVLSTLIQSHTVYLPLTVR